MVRALTSLGVSLVVLGLLFASPEANAQEQNYAYPGVNCVSESYPSTDVYDNFGSINSDEVAGSSQWVICPLQRAVSESVPNYVQMAVSTSSASMSCYLYVGTVSSGGSPTYSEYASSAGTAPMSSSVQYITLTPPTIPSGQLPRAWWVECSVYEKNQVFFYTVDPTQ